MNQTKTPTRLGEVLDTYLRDLQAGRSPDRQALLVQNPELGPDLVAALESLDFIHGATRESRVEDPEDQAGKSLGDYRLLREVGRGGMAVVYEAEQLSLGRRVALKVLPFAAVLDPKKLQRFKNEALAAAHLHHPHIVPVYGVGCERGVHYYAMQFVEGQSLAQAIRDMRSAPEERASATPVTSHGSHREPGYVRFVTELGVQAADALEHAHQLGVIHRDVKPANLLVDPSGSLWITDFGLARSLLRDTGLTMTGELLGTVRYMSPEQAMAKPEPVDHRTDVYSLGVTLFELLTLEPAIPGNDPHVVLQNTLQHEPTPPRRANPSLSIDLETVLLKAMAKDPSGRYATAQEMADDLRRCLLDRPILARRPSLATRAARWSRRHRGLVAAAVSVLLVGVAALAIGAKRQERETRKALAQALDAVDRFLALAALDSFVDGPLPPPSRRALIESALKFYAAYPDDPSVLMKSSVMLHALQRYDEAFVCAERAAALRPTEPGFQVQLGHMLRHVGRAEEGLALLDRVVAAQPGFAEARFQLGNALYGVGRFEDAIVALDEAIRLDETSASYLATKGNALMRLGRYDDALAAFDRSLDLEPFNAEALYGRGNALQCAGHPEEAVPAYQAAIAVQPESPGSHLMLGRAFMTLRRFKDAAKEYEKANRLAPGDAEAHHNLGIALCWLGRPADAAEAFGKSLKIRPSDPSTHYGLANALRDTGDREGAMREFREAFRLKEDFAEAHCNLAVLLRDAGETERAGEEFKAALDANKELPEAHLGLGYVHLDAHRLEDAVACYRDAIRCRENFARAHSSLGLALHRLGRFEEAVAPLRRGLDLGSTHPSAESIERTERLAALAKRLERVLSGAEPPSSSLERVDLADVLYAKSRHLDAAEAWSDAFAADPELAADLRSWHRYNAACCASLASTAGDAGAEAWRRRALEWLRADLQARDDAGMLATTGRWRSDPDLAVVRDRLEVLPATEREEWMRFWADVDERLAREQRR